MAKRKKQDYEPPVVFGLCDHCGQSGQIGSEVNPYSVAFKVTKWLHRSCYESSRLEAANRSPAAPEKVPRA